MRKDDFACLALPTLPTLFAPHSKTEAISNNNSWNTRYIPGPPEECLIFFYDPQFSLSNNSLVLMESFDSHVIELSSIAFSGSRAQWKYPYLTGLKGIVIEFIRFRTFTLIFYINTCVWTPLNFGLGVSSLLRVTIYLLPKFPIKSERTRRTQFSVMLNRQKCLKKDGS